MEDAVKKILLNYDGWLEAFSNLIPLAILDEAFNVISSNNKFNDLVGLNKEIIVGSRLPNLLEVGSDKFDYIFSLLKTGTSWSGQIKNIHGTFIPANHEYIFIINCFGKEESQDRLLLLDQIAFRVSHYIRKPIASMQGLIELVNIDAFDENQCKILLGHLRTCVNDLDQCSRELSQLVSDVR